MAECKGLYFGNSEYMTWAPAPDSGMDMTASGWGESGTMINGGAYVRRSQNAAQAYQMNWSMKRVEDLDKVFDFYHGRYGEGPFHMLMPGTYSNVLPRAWSMPRLHLADAPPLAKDEAPPTAVSVGAHYGRPTVAARYTLVDAGSPRRALTIPLPPNFYLHLGVHGTFDAGIRMYVNNTPLVPLSTTSPTLTNAVVSAPGLHTLQLRGTGTATISAITARISDSAFGPFGDFVPGKGISAVEFEPGSVSKTMYSAVKNWYGGSATMVEVGQWA